MSDSSNNAPAFAINSSTGAYEVVVVRDSFTAALHEIGAGFVISDAFFSAQLEQMNVPHTVIEADEHAKSLDAMPRLIEGMRAGGVNRGTHLAAVGGGVIQDIAAFTASVYMRGVAWSYFPTTVLAMVDSCIGGKSSINVGPYKNLIGTFHPPARILIDPSVAGTLPPEQFAGGLIEAAKICFCRGEESFAQYLACRPSARMPPAQLERVILTSLHAKKWFIETDEFDKKERLLLNFGHTFGHALEGASGYALSHGIAVGIGILCSFSFQRSRGSFNPEPERIAALEAHLRVLIGTSAGLKATLLAVDLDDVLTRFKSDKKHSTESFTLILVDGLGHVIRESFARTPAVEAAIRNAVQSTLGTLAL